MERQFPFAGPPRRFPVRLGTNVRIIAGEWRGRRIVAPPGDRVRPTGDRVREAWMSIVAPDLPDARVLDLFSGSGALALEALSRGAASADVVEIAPPSLATIRKNAEAVGAGDRLSIHRGDALRFAKELSAGAYDIAFADPPYGEGLATKLAELWIATPFSSVLGIEHRVTETLPGSDDRRRYGTSVITFFRSDRA
jgi:16S rRNA (guanine966-N2)-methyltransferase